MTATNHALTGALIGLTISNPWLAVPAALLSHVICDMIPHFGMGEAWIKQKSFRLYLLGDALLCIVLVGLMAITAPAGWLLAVVCAFVATSPDLLWIRKFMLRQQRKPFHETGLERFLVKIQWFEKPSGLIVELAWATGTIVLLSAFIWQTTA